MPRIAVLALTASLLIGAAGCQNSLKIKVEMLGSGEQRIRGSTYADSVGSGLLALRAYARLLERLKETAYEQSDDQSSYRLAMADIESDKGAVARLSERGIQLGDELAEGKLALQDVAMTVESYLARISTFLGTRVGAWEMRTRQAPGELKEVYKAVLDQSFYAEIESLIKVASRAAGSVGQFGGFLPAGVHQIDPSDPAYAWVLKSKPIGRSVTSVDAAALGDSTIMFVQESPTQLRVLHVEMDPTQLVQNVIYISDKVLQAAIKFLAPLPAD
ncbi:MAG: hypothetical protein KAV82_00355 [Phycisphaerae bacterium]|nr:hypothetical protein [Phycisphaerae bacterium]